MSNIFGERLSSIRKGRGMTREELAEQLNMSPNTLRNYENGVREPGHKFVVEMSKLFSVSTDYLLGVSDEDKKNPPVAETATRDKVEITKLLTEALTKGGFLDENGLISDEDFEFLKALVIFIDDHFSK